MIDKVSVQKYIKRIAKILAWIFVAFLVLSITISLLLLVPTVQNFVTDKATQFISDKTGMEAKIGSIYLGFPKTLKLGGIFIADANSDTLLYCHGLEIDIDMIPLLRKNANVALLSIDGLRANVYQNLPDSSFNFSPWIDAFSNEKETTSPVAKKLPWKIGFDKIELSDIKADYHSEVDSSTINLNLGMLLISANKVDLANNIFDLDKIDLKNTSFSMTMAQSNDTTVQSDSLHLPFDINLSALDLANIQFDLQSVDGKFGFSAKAGSLNVLPNQLDLKTFTIDIDKLNADAIDVALKIIPSDTMENQDNIPEPETASPYTFGNIPWQIVVHLADIANTNYKMDLGVPPDAPTSAMDYSHLFIQNINFVADSVYFNKNATGGKINQLLAEEQSGAQLKQVNGIVKMNNNSIQAKDMYISMNNSLIEGTAAIGYVSLNKIGENISNMEISSDLKGHIHLDDIKPFTSVVQDYPLLKNLGDIHTKGIKTHGSLGNMTLEKSDITLGKTTNIRAHGHIKGLPSTNLQINFSLDTLRTGAMDIAHFLPDTLLPNSIRLPENIGLSADFSYRENFMDFEAFLVSDFGNATFMAHQLKDSLSANFDLNDIDAGSFLADSTFGKITTNGQFKGLGSTEKLNSFKAEVNIVSAGLMNRQYNNLNIDIDGNDTDYSFIASIQDSALAFTAKGKASIMDSLKSIAAEVQIAHADLNKMEMIENDLTLSGNVDLQSEFKNTNDILTNIHLTNFHLAKKYQNYDIEEVKLTADIQETYTNFDIVSDIFTASLSGNTKISELRAALNNHLDNYIQMPDSLLSEKEFQFDFELQLNKPEFFTDFLLEDLKEFSIEKFQANYNGKNDIFEVNIVIPEVTYAKIDVDDLSLILTSSKDSIKSVFNIAQLAYDSATVRNFSIKSSFHDQQAEFLFSTHDHPDTIKYRSEIQLAFDQGAYNLHLNPDNLIINEQTWVSSQDNSVIFKDNNIIANNASITNGNQKVWMSSKGKDLKLNFQNFQIKNITDILETQQYQLRGQINGYLETGDFFNPGKLKSALEIHELSFRENTLGNLSINLDATSTDTLVFETILKNNDNLVSIDGHALLASSSPKIDGTIKTNINKAEAFSGFLEEYASDLQGGLESDLNIKGSILKPVINGHMNFNNLSMTVKPSTSTMATNGNISIKDNLIQFNDFVLTDSLNHQLTVKGSIQAKDVYNPEFGLSITSQEFMAINSQPAKDNLVVGKLLLGIGIDIKGKLSALSVNSSFTIHKNTDIMYIMPGKDLELISDKDIVTFENYAMQIDSVIDKPQFLTDTLFSALNAADVSIDLLIDPQARFRIYIDPNSGDITEFKLDGKLNYKYNRTERGRLSGLVELTEGYYELSFYGLVKKKFIYDPGSSITWSGDIMEGNIDLTARYVVRTNSVGLVSNEISNYEKSMYNQQLPYQVLLHIKEEIAHPVFSFSIELPDRYTSEQPILESKLNMLNLENNASELNKQVFALLVGGTFIPDNPDVSEGSDNKSFATTAARNSVNSIMTQQLNNLTGQFIKGVDLEMGVNTFEDYTTGKAETQTQLDVKVSKNLFNDRVSAEVESHINLDGSTQTAGSQSTLGQTEFAVTYQLTETGNYLIKAFRENAWDLFDGEIQNAGIAFIFVKEFDHFKRSDKSSSKVENPVDSTPASK